MGIHNERLLQQLLTQDHRKALEELFELARTFEVAEKESLRRAEDNSAINSSTVTAAVTGSKPTKRTVTNKKQSGSAGQCASCGGSHLRTTCKFRNVKCRKCHKQGHIQRVCQSSAVVQSTHSPHSVESAVVTVSPAESVSDIPPVFQIVDLPEFSRKLRLVVDSASPITFINSKTWLDLNKPKLQSTDRVLGAFEGQPIHPLGYFEAKVSREGEVQNVAVLQMYVSQKGINIMGRDGLTKLNITITPEMFGRVATIEPVLPAPLQDLLNVYEDLFKPELGHCVTTTANLCLREGAQPKFCKPRKLPFALKPVVGDELDRLERQGVIEKVPHSDWATPVVIVRKPGGKVRICGDFKVTINPLLKTDIYPLPNPQELFQALNGGCKFTKLDLADAYLQVELNEESKKMVVINTHKGLYRYRRLPFGLNCAPAIFQKIIDQTVAGIPGVVSYLDDLVVTGKTDQEHIANLKKALDRLKTAGFRLKLEKCEFFQAEVRYLGHIIDKSGIRPQPDKLKAIVDMPFPQNAKELRSFLGMVNYYDKFTPGLASKCAVLNDLLHKDAKWKWSKQHSKAVEVIKTALTSTETLTHYDQDLPLSLACDASTVGVGAVIFHTFPDGKERPIAYASRKLSKAEKNYAQIQKEALAIIYGVQKFRQYLIGRKFCLITDHKPLLSIFNPAKGIPEMVASRLQRWAITLSSYNYEVKYQASNKHGNADALSRLPLDTDEGSNDELTDTVCLLEQQQLSDLPIKAADIQQGTVSDPILSKVYNFTVRGWPASIKSVPDDIKPFYSKRLELTTFSGCLLLGLRVVVPAQFQEAVLKLLHEGHPGMTRMKSLARLHVWWPLITTDIEQTVQGCTNCAVMARDPQKVPLHSWDFPRKPWQRLHLDYAGPFKGKMWLILIDAYSKWPEVHEMSETTSKATIQQLRKIFAVQGLPELIVTDNGPQFVSEEFKSFCQQRGIQHKTIAPYHPRSNEEAERLVETFKLSINKADPKTTTELENSVLNFLAKYRSTPHTLTNCSPAEMLNQRRLRTTLDLLHPCQSEIAQGRLRQKVNYDVHTKARQYVIGDAVWIRNFRSGPRWIAGTVKKHIGRVMYEVEIDGKNVIWRRHANQLRTRFASLPMTDTSSATTADQNQAPPEPRVLRRSTRVRKPRVVWTPT